MAASSLFRTSDEENYKQFSGSLSPVFFLRLPRTLKQRLDFVERRILGAPGPFLSIFFVDPSPVSVCNWAHLALIPTMASQHLQGLVGFR